MGRKMIPGRRNSFRAQSLAILAAMGCMAALAHPAAADFSHSALSWLYPGNSAAQEPGSGPPGSIQAIHLPGSPLRLTRAQLTDLFAAPDWHPDAHSAMPPIVAFGRKPKTYACGYCHLPAGQGRPENASLAGLPQSYIIEQVANFKAGLRRRVWPGAPPVNPRGLMAEVADTVTDEELANAAAYFSAQTLVRRTYILERGRIPRVCATAWIYVLDPSGGTESLGERLIEYAPSLSAHESRDDRMRYIAFVPTGSIERGRKIATKGTDGAASACTACHGPRLRGPGLAPPLAGRSPSYLLRQLVEFESKARSAPAALPMQAVAGQLTLAQMIAAAAYAGSLDP